MRHLFLIRHAKSSWDNPGLRDFNRPLNERGMHDAPRMAKYLHKLNVQAGLIVSSPAKRALTTAQFFAAEFGFPDEAIRQEETIYEAMPSDIQRIISGLPDETDTVLLFGHNPTLTEVSNLFTDDFIDNVPTCGIVHLISTAASWSELYEDNTRIQACYFPKEVL